MVGYVGGDSKSPSLSIPLLPKVPLGQGGTSDAWILLPDLVSAQLITGRVSFCFLNLLRRPRSPMKDLALVPYPPR